MLSRILNLLFVRDLEAGSLAPGWAKDPIVGPIVRPIVKLGNVSKERTKTKKIVYENRT